MWSRVTAVGMGAAVLVLVSACGASAVRSAQTTMPPPSAPSASAASGPTGTSTSSPAVADPLPGMPPVRDPSNVAADAGAGMLSAAAAAARPMVYVPHNSGDVWEIDPTTFQVVRTFPVGTEIQHVVPSWDMRTLYATDDLGATSITPIDPVSGLPSAKIPVVDPYNMYFTPDGTAAISVAEDLKSLVFYDPHTWAEQSRLAIPECAGIDHADFSEDGRTAVFTCEFAGRVAVVDIPSRTTERIIDMPVRNTHMGPQDIKLAPDGSRWYVADSDLGGLWVLDAAATKVIGNIPTGAGAHGIYYSRDASRLYVSNRHDDSISVLDSRTGAAITTWRIPAPSSPDMGGVTADGSQLWLSGRYDSEVYVISTADGHLIQRIKVGNGPHGLCVWPQPGRYSLGHTGITR